MSCATPTGSVVYKGKTYPPSRTKELRDTAAADIQRSARIYIAKKKMSNIADNPVQLSDIVSPPQPDSLEINGNSISQLEEIVKECSITGKSTNLIETPLLRADYK